MDHERLARVATHPNHFRKDGSIKPGMFPPKHIKETGLSLIRVDHIDEAELRRQAEAVAGCKPGETVRGVRLCSVRDLREIAEPSASRSVCVKDDPIANAMALPDNPAHAVVIRADGQDDPEILRIQGILTDVFGALMSIEDVYKVV